MAESSGLEHGNHPGAKGHNSAMQVHLRKTLHQNQQSMPPFNNAANSHNAGGQQYATLNGDVSQKLNQSSMVVGGQNAGAPGAGKRVNDSMVLKSNSKRDRFNQQ